MPEPLNPIRTSLTATTDAKPHAKGRPAESVLWWVCLIVAPAILMVIELWHPANFSRDPGMYEYLSQPEPYNPRYAALGYFGPQWWFMLHMIQTPMVGLVAVGLWLMVDRIASSGSGAAMACAWISRAATFVFLIYYTMLDTGAGTELGRSLELTGQFAQSGQLTAEQVSGIKLLLDTLWSDPWIGGQGSWVSLTGSWAVFVAALFAAAALFLAKAAPWPALILLVAFGWQLEISHTMPHGPIAFALLIASALWMRFSSRAD